MGLDGIRVGWSIEHLTVLKIVKKIGSCAAGYLKYTLSEHNLGKQITRVWIRESSKLPRHYFGRSPLEKNMTRRDAHNLTSQIEKHNTQTHTVSNTHCIKKYKNTGRDTTHGAMRSALHTASNTTWKVCRDTHATHTASKTTWKVCYDTQTKNIAMHTTEHNKLKSIKTQQQLLTLHLADICETKWKDRKYFSKDLPINSDKKIFSCNNKSRQKSSLMINGNFGPKLNERV